jgi:hypothetical protein
MECIAVKGQGFDSPPAIWSLVTEAENTFWRAREGVA